MAQRSLPQRCGRVVGWVLVVSALVFAGLVAVVAIAEPTHDVVVFGPPEASMQAVATGPSLLLDAGQTFILVRGLRAGFVRELYAGGAWLVLPAMSGGCRTPFGTTVPRATAAAKP
jgi:hypothetical protein